MELSYSQLKASNEARMAVGFLTSPLKAQSCTRETFPRALFFDLPVGRDSNRAEKEKFAGTDTPSSGGEWVK